MQLISNGKIVVGLSELQATRVASAAEECHDTAMT